jgi:histidyl-tRNA synthetase
METVKGFKDFLLEEASRREEIRKILVETFEKYGFCPAETPVIEQEEFVKGDNSSDEAVSDIFKLQDKGKRNLALRYEFTFQLKRLMNNQKLPFKRYEIGPIFRDEPVSQNRLRQFVQCDCDIVGSELKDNAEIFSLAKDLLEKLRIEYTIYVNNRKLLNEILEKESIKNPKEVIKILDKLDKISESEIIEELKKYGAEKILEKFKQKESFFEKYEAYQEIKKLKEYCSLYGVSLIFSPTLARGLSYYNGTIFEIKTKEMKETIIGGGEFFFNNTQCVGISFGLDRLSVLSKIESKNTEYLIVSLNEDKQAIEIAKKLREKGTSCSIFYGKPSKALAYANSYKINGVIFVGADEVKKKSFKIKDMKTGKEKILVLEKKTKRNVILKKKG